MAKKKKRTFWQWLVRIFAGYELTIINILLLLLIVFFSTLEQAEVGLYTVKQRYYAIDAYFVQPELRGTLLPIVLPGAYWVCVLFTINLLCGGIVKMIAVFVKNPSRTMSFPDRFGKFIGVLISHISMATLMIAGAVDYHMSKMTLLEVREGEEGFIGRSDEDVVLEVYEIEDGVETDVHVISNKYISNMIRNGQVSSFNFSPDKKVFSFDGKPFKVEFGGWYRNCDVMPENKAKHVEGDGPVVDGVFLREDELLTATETGNIARFNTGVAEGQRKKIYNLAGCYIDVVADSGERSKLVLWSGMQGNATVSVGDKIYGFRIGYRREVLPFKIALKELEVQKYQGTMKARDYVSNVKYNTGKEDVDARISMNEPLRHSGYTIYQARWDKRGVDVDGRDAYVTAQKAAGKPLEFAENHRLYSTYQIVSNPADKWPEYCVYVGGIGLSIHFLIKLIFFILASFKKRQSNEG